MDKNNKSKKFAFKITLIFLLILFLTACSASKSSPKPSSSSSQMASTAETSVPSSSQIMHTSNPTQRDLMAEIWYSKSNMSYVTFDETKVAYFNAYEGKKRTGAMPISYPYTADKSVITYDFGMTGVDDTFALTWEGDMIVMSPLGRGEDYGKIHAEYLIPINNTEELVAAIPWLEK